MCWYVKNLGDAMLADEAIIFIQETFQSVHAKAHYCKEMAIFMRHESARSLHCEVKVYFSPAAVNVALKVNAHPCSKPSADGLSVLSGDKNSKQLLIQ